MALRGKCTALYGVDTDPNTLELARENQVVDQASSVAAEVLAQADLVILAAPVGVIIDLLAALPSLHPGAAVVVDLGSTKARITGVMDGLPQRFDPIGGHPMCGKETSSLASADPSIFKGAPFALTPLPRTTGRALHLAKQLVLATGARPFWLDPQTHDRWVAATSHLPYLVATSLVLATPMETAPLIGPGFRSTARLAASNSRMMRDVLETNREHILSSLRAFKSALELIETYLEAGDFTSAESLLEKAVRQYTVLDSDSQPGERG